MNAIIKSVLALSFLIFSTSSFAKVGNTLCKCNCIASFEDDKAMTFPAKGNTVADEKKYCASNNEEDCSYKNDKGEEVDGYFEDCKRVVIDETKDTLSRLGIEMK